MGQLTNAETDKNVQEFIKTINDEQQREDAKLLLDVFQELTNTEPKIWGSSIIGYGKYRYQRKNGDEYEWFNTGFAPRSKKISIYLMFDIAEEHDLLSKLGPHSHGRGCL